MIKFKAIIEVLFLSFFICPVCGLWQVIFNNKRVNFSCDLKPLYKKKKPKIPTDKEIFLDFMARNT